MGGQETQVDSKANYLEYVRRIGRGMENKENTGKWEQRN